MGGWSSRRSHYGPQNGPQNYKHFRGDGVIPFGRGSKTFLHAGREKKSRGSRKKKSADKTFYLRRRKFLSPPTKVFGISRRQLLFRPKDACSFWVRTCLRSAYGRARVLARGPRFLCISYATQGPDADFFARKNLGRTIARVLTRGT